MFLDSDVGKDLGEGNGEDGEEGRPLPGRVRRDRRHRERKREGEGRVNGRTRRSPFGEGWSPLWGGNSERRDVGKFISSTVRQTDRECDLIHYRLWYYK